MAIYTIELDHVCYDLGVGECEELINISCPFEIHDFVFSYGVETDHDCPDTELHDPRFMSDTEVEELHSHLRRSVSQFYERSNK